MDEAKRFSLIKPSIDTPFHIDFDWWREHDNNWRVFLHSCLCLEHQKAFLNLDQDCCIDFVDPETAEVSSVDGLQHILITHCAKQSGFIVENAALTDSLFRILLAGGNGPMSPKEMGQVLNRSSDMILKTLTGSRVYRGIRPCNAC
jgi:hypothetical protein